MLRLIGQFKFNKKILAHHGGSEWGGGGGAYLEGWVTLFDYIVLPMMVSARPVVHIAMCGQMGRILADVNVSVFELSQRPCIA